MDEKPETKIIDLSKFSRNLPRELELTPEDEYFNLGIEQFNSCIDDAIGFLSIVFDENGVPTIIWAGDVDTFSAIGALEVSKDLFSKKVFGTPNSEFDEF